MDEIAYEVGPTIHAWTWGYTLMVDLTVLNLMIAVMTDTYFKVAAGSAISKWRLARVHMNAECIRCAARPRDFRPPPHPTRNP